MALQIGPSVYVYVDVSEVELYDEALLESMDELAGKVAADPYVSNCSITGLPKDLLALYSAAANKDDFHSSLKVGS